MLWEWCSGWELCRGSGVVWVVVGVFGVRVFAARVSY